MDRYFLEKNLHGAVTKRRLQRVNEDIIDDLFNHQSLAMRLMLVRNANNVGKIEHWKPYRRDKYRFTNYEWIYY
ncbi:hypothetical protein BLOT_016540 [Blomia tropicalis]|nr:hypothetical protein BLOT_016540 [Blomia tropicalis]